MSRSHAMRTADEAELGVVWAAVRADHLFGSREEFEAAWREAPWRVQVSEAGDAAVLDRWREHSGLLAIQGLWCAERTMPAIVRDLVSLARSQGFDGVLSPLVPERLVEPYREAGMAVIHRGITMRLERPSSHAPEPSVAAQLRIAGPADEAAIEAIDHACFDEFWRFDRRMLVRYLADQRAVLATRHGAPIGYTLCTVSNGDGMLGRLAVLPAERGRGVGALLLSDAVAYMARAGARVVTLYTQEENVPSRALYARGGFRELPGTSCFLVAAVH
ncbi:MAG: GNAT family N-acetyltransferase [Actinobacteria bacterium]|nr:MAG: GNAT family N-acetyltransferase [Actinomycetota bacterium]